MISVPLNNEELLSYQEEFAVFGIGGTELVLILLFGFLIFGPDKLPQIARTVGKAIRQFKGAQEKMNEVIKSEVYDPLNDLSKEMNPFSTLSSESTAKTAASANSSNADVALPKSDLTPVDTPENKTLGDTSATDEKSSLPNMTFADAAKAAAATKVVGPARKSAGVTKEDVSVAVEKPVSAVRQETFVERKAAAEEKKVSQASAIYGVSPQADASETASSSPDVAQGKEGEE
jgi:TatA/E family protein of Tat protein translocase